MENNEEKPFAEVLQTILNDEPIPVHLLYRLSDMNEADNNLFFKEWAALESDRRRVIVRHLADISEESFVVDFTPIFTDGLMDEQEQVRLAALDGLWDSTERKFIPILIDMMQNDSSIEVRAAAAASLAHYVLMAEWGEIPERASQPIVNALLQVYDEEETAVPVRRAAVEALGASSHDRIPKIIQEAYESENVGMQMSAVFAMGNSADPRWLPTIIGEMENPRDEIRAEAARAAGSIGKSDAISELADLTEDEELEVQLAAVHALGQIGGGIAQEILDGLLADEEKEDIHEAVEEALEELIWTSGELNFMDLEFDDEDAIDVP